MKISKLKNILEIRIWFYAIELDNLLYLIAKDEN